MGRFKRAGTWFIAMILIFIQMQISLISQGQASNPSIEGGQFETEHFTLTYQAGAQNLARKISSVAESIYANATEFMNYTPSMKVSITVNDTVEPFYDWLEYWGGDYFGNTGYAMNDREITMLVPPGWTTESLGGVSMDSVALIFAHEFNHVLLRGCMYTQFSVLPRWYIEGLANYYSRVVYGEGYYALQKYVLAKAFQDGKFDGLDDLSGWAYNEEDVGPAYIAGQSVFEYIENEYGGREAVNKFVENFRDWDVGISSSQNLNNIIHSSFSISRIKFENGWLDALNNSKIQAPQMGELPSSAERLTNSTMTKVPTSWGPAGILYLDGSNGSLDIYLLNETDRTTAALTTGNGTDSDAKFSPDGTKIAFTSMRDGTFDLFLMNADGSGIEQLMFDDWVNVAPSWSPDGKKLAFVSDRNGEYDIFELYLANLSVNPLVVSQYNDGAPAYSPDGTRLAFCSNRSGEMGIHILNLATGEISQPTKEFEGALFPSWSPDCMKIAFIDSARDLMVYDFDKGTTVTMIESGFEKGVVYATSVWSPDGSMLCSAVGEWRTSTVWDVNLYIFDSDAEAGRQVNIIFIFAVVATVVVLASAIVYFKRWHRFSV